MAQVRIPKRSNTKLYSHYTNCLRKSYCKQRKIQNFKYLIENVGIIGKIIFLKDARFRVDSTVSDLSILKIGE